MADTLAPPPDGRQWHVQVKLGVNTALEHTGTPHCERPAAVETLGGMPAGDLR
jgi:hypothetical protein